MVPLKNMPEISFLILTYNSEKYIGKLLNSLFYNCREKITNGSYEILIFDNNSSDETSRVIEDLRQKETRKSIQFFSSKENLGYAKGINKLASLANGKILIVINPDAEILSGDFSILLKEFDKKENLAISGMRVVDAFQKEEKTAGSFFNPFSFFLYSLGLENVFSLRFAPKKIKKVDFVSGGFIAFKKELFESLEGYDEDYFMYVEDMDICFRAKKKKYEVFYIPCATIKHQGQGSSNREFAIVNIYKGLQIFYQKNKSPVELWFIKSLLGLKAAAIIFIGAIIGNKSLVNTYKRALAAIE